LQRQWRGSAVIIKDWRPHSSGTLHGYVTVQLAIGLVIPDMPVFMTPKGHQYATLPTKPIVENGKHRTTADGKFEYRPTVYWSNRQTGDKFSTAVIRLLLAKHPDALSRPVTRPQTMRPSHLDLPF
jgi:hypothetical protein